MNSIAREGKLSPRKRQIAEDPENNELGSASEKIRKTNEGGTIPFTHSIRVVAAVEQPRETQ